MPEKRVKVKECVALECVCKADAFLRRCKNGSYVYGPCENGCRYKVFLEGPHYQALDVAGLLYMATPPADTLARFKGKLIS